MLDTVKGKGNWETWPAFFAEAIVRTADQAVFTAKELQKIFSRNVATIEGLGKAKRTARAIYDTQPGRGHGENHATINNSLRNLEIVGIVKEASGRKRNRVHTYTEHIHIMDMGLDIPGEHAV